MKFKMKSIASILVAAAMMAAMATPVFAIGSSDDEASKSGKLEFEEGTFDELSPQRRIVLYDGMYKVNADETFSSFRDGKINSENSDIYRVGSVPYAINIKVGETIRIKYAADFNFYFNSNLTDKTVIQQSSIDGDDEVGYTYTAGITDYTGKAPGVYVGPIIANLNTDEHYGSIIWNITEDGSILTDEQVANYSAKGAAAGKGITFDIGSDTPRGGDTPPSETTEETPPTTEAPVVTHYEGGESYTIQAGDTFGVLSLNNYGSYKYADALYAANAAILKSTKDGKIYKGLTIVIPETIATGVNKLAPQTLYEGEKLYTVKSEDTLGTIALAHYKDMSKYKAIFERNADRLKNANTIYAGQIIILP